MFFLSYELFFHDNLKYFNDCIRHLKYNKLG